MPASRTWLTTVALLGGVALANALIEGASRIKLPQSAETLAATAAGDPLYAAAIDRPEGRVLVLAAKLDKSDLTLRHDFPRLIGNALAWLCPEAARAGAAVTTGAAIALPFGGRPVAAETSAGCGTEVAAGGDAGRPRPCRPVDRDGSGENGDDTSNLASARKATCGTVPVSCNDFKVPEAVYDRPLWMLLVGAAVIFVAEWCLFHRRIVV